MLRRVMDIDENLQVWNYLNYQNSTIVGTLGTVLNLSLKVVGAGSLWNREMDQGGAAGRKGGEGEGEEGKRLT